MSASCSRLTATRFRQSVPPTLSLAIALLTSSGLLLLTPLPTAAQKGGKPSDPPPPGTILFDDLVNRGSDGWYRQQRGMNPDGTGGKTAFDHRFLVHPVPSALVYGTDPVLDRWWLTIDEVQVEGASHTVYEVFACRLDAAGNLQQVQLTALYPHVTFRPTWAHSYLCWSNDGADSFVSFRGRTYGADTAETPADQSDPSDDLLHVFRLNVSGADIQAAFDQGADPEFGIDDFAGGWIESVLETGEDLSEYALGYHDWSPDGTQVAYVMPWALWVADCSGGPATHGDSQTYPIWTECRFPRWSPDGQRIALSHDGSVWTVKPDGAGAALVLGSTRSERYAVPVWSPDGRHLAIEHFRYKTGRYDYFISRVSATGGAVTVLTKSLDPTAEKRLTGWPSNLPAGP